MLKDIILAMGFMAVLCAVFFPLAVNAIVRESEWRQDRLCRIYHVGTCEGITNHG